MCVFRQLCVGDLKCNFSESLQQLLTNSRPVAVPRLDVVGETQEGFSQGFHEVKSVLCFF